jgi:hypothetical protein
LPRWECCPERTGRLFHLGASRASVQNRFQKANGFPSDFAPSPTVPLRYAKCPISARSSLGSGGEDKAFPDASRSEAATAQRLIVSHPQIEPIAVPRRRSRQKPARRFVKQDDRRRRKSTRWRGEISGAVPIPRFCQACSTADQA